ncbi:MAG TPA: MFS transporter, partial [Candidimonas sp.]|nr:MFS transporter [Candidimonas sp.]
MTPGTLPLPFRRLVWSNLLAQAADQIGLATAPLLAVFLFSASTSETAILQTVQSLPFLLAAIPAGLLADRSSRKTILAMAEALRA